MAWTEKIGPRSWRVRYLRGDGGYGSISGFETKTAADAYATQIEADQRRGTWLDPKAGFITTAEWAALWADTLDVETRTEENYLGRIHNHIQPRWGTIRLGAITPLAVTLWAKQLRRRYAASTVAGILTVFSMMLDDAVDERLIPANPVRRRSRRGRRRDNEPMPAERLWATPEQVVWIADQAALLSNSYDYWLLIVTTGWTGARWGEMTGLQRANTHLDHGYIVIDPDTGCLHESVHRMWLGPPKTPASARTITLPPFLITLLRQHLESHDHEFVFTTPRGHWLRRSNFDRRVFRPAIDGNQHRANPAARTYPIKPGLTFHGLRHSHKTWMIADGIPEIAQASRLGHRLDNRIVETYSHVAPRSNAALCEPWNAAGTRHAPPPTPPCRPPASHDPHRDAVVG